MKALPFDDPSVTALDDATRAAVATHWLHRAKAELEVGRAFEAMGQRLAPRASALVLEMLARSADEEVRHAAICVRLAETYAGAPVRAPQVDAVRLPSFGFDADPELEDALLVAGMCCVNETIATAWLGTCLEAATAPLAIAANKVHLTDEIDHARLGWAHVADVSRATKAKLGALIGPLVAANVPSWERADPDLPAAGVESHGLLGVARTRAVVRDAVRTLVLPGFAHVGIDTSRARPLE